ncbi:hypothetical protein [Ornithinibacillus xuwenensis]|uniref:Uncharacterized protein n=1 Tax=Ornithinibacillus xuwenensis TaxID=3144668 RepID=A0ABU9XNG8_9BACI
MNLLYKDDQIILENNEEAMTKIFERISEIINKQDVVFSHLVIDDVEVYENHEAYIMSHLSDIDKIEIVTTSTRRMVWETMTSIHAYLERGIPTLKELITESYDKYTEKTWDGINKLAESMQLILQFVEFTNNTNEYPANWSTIEESVKACQESFRKLMEGIEMKDTILISDILSYEVVPAYEDLYKQLSVSLDDKEFLQNVN